MLKKPIAVAKDRKEDDKAHSAVEANVLQRPWTLDLSVSIFVSVPLKALRWPLTRSHVVPPRSRPLAALPSPQFVSVHFLLLDLRLNES